MPDLGIYRLESNFFVQKLKCLNLGPKMSYLGVLWLEFENIFNQRPRICQK